MGRWEPDAPGRLERAALDLYGERGFEHTTVADIAARAGLTERTFFRYFADKREVLFARSSDLQDALVEAVVAAPPDVAPFDAVAGALDAAAAMFDERRDHAARRQAVIAASPELQERELTKLATLASALTDALHRRGVADPSSGLAAEAGIAVFKIAFERWIDASNGRDLSDILGETFDQLKAVTAGP